MSSSMKDFLDKFFDLCREYQQEIPPKKMAEVLREYADRLDGWRIMAIWESIKGLYFLGRIYPNFFKLKINFMKILLW